MKAMNRRVNHLFAFGVLLLASAGCNAIFGFDERTLDEPDSEEVCLDYCERIQGICTGEAFQFESDDICISACLSLSLGEIGDRTGNTVECRMSFLDDAEELEGEERTNACAIAGFVSIDRDGQPGCGDPCVSYCEAMRATCPDTVPGTMEDADCDSLCRNLEVATDWTANDPNDKDVDDTLQCRLWHLANATNLPNNHCGHAEGEVKCDDVPGP